MPYIAIQSISWQTQSERHNFVYTFRNILYYTSVNGEIDRSLKLINGCLQLHDDDDDDDSVDVGQLFSILDSLQAHSVVDKLVGKLNLAYGEPVGVWRLYHNANIADLPRHVRLNATADGSAFAGEPVDRVVAGLRVQCERCRPHALVYGPQCLYLQRSVVQTIFELFRSTRLDKVSYVFVL